MYSNLCRHFNRDPTTGIDWKTAREVWVQAQGQQKAKSPPPPKQNQNGKPPPTANPSHQIKQAFIACDKDGDGCLNKAEFHEFVKIGFKKVCVYIYEYIFIYGCVYMNNAVCVCVCCM